jgi:2-haloalkanoic acid dehalogenase type II
LNKIYPKAILMDFYGTVVEEIHLPVKTICSEVCAAGHYRFQESDFVRYWVSGFTRLCEESYGDHFQLQKEIEVKSLQAAIDHFGVDLNAVQLGKELENYRAHPSLFPESQAVLKRLKLPLCLVTNIDIPEIQSALQFTGLRFDYVITSEQCRAYKPRPEVFQKALDAVGFPASRVLHVGDSYQGDIQGAQALGIPVLWIDRGERPLSGGARRPDFTASNLNGLTELLD